MLLLLRFDSCDLTLALLFSFSVNFRARYNLDGNMFADYLLSCFMWPQIIVQMLHEMEVNPMEKEDEDA